MKRLLVALTLVSMLVLMALPAYAQTGDIVDIAVNDGRFTTLVSAVTAAGLVDTLKGPGPYTVFAPTDDAFKALPAGTVEGLLKDPAALKDVLLYHVVAGEVYAADVTKLTSATAANNKDLTVTVKDGKVMINNAQVIITDIKASNGVIHVIDAVLVPPAEAPAALPATGAETGNNLIWLAVAGLAITAAGVGLSLKAKNSAI